jgi:hypothetical protein
MRKQVTFVFPTHHFNQSLVVRKLFRVVRDFCWQIRGLAAKREAFRRRIEPEKAGFFIRAKLRGTASNHPWITTARQAGCFRFLPHSEVCMDFITHPRGKIAGRFGRRLGRKSRSGW